MKKYFFICILLIVLFNSCFSKTNEKTTRSMPLTEREKSLEAAKRLDALIARDNEEIDFDSSETDISIYAHNQVLRFPERQRKVYSKPFTMFDENVIYLTQNGDELQVNRVFYEKSHNRTYVEVSLPTGETGYIRFPKNPYKDGQFSFKEELLINGNPVKVLNLKRPYTFEGFPNRPAIIQRQPDFNSEIIAKVSGAIILECTAITADYNWLNVIYEDHEAWMNTKYLCDGKGGPLLYTPEETFCEELWGEYR